MIKVKNNWSWITSHAKKMLMKDEQLQNDFFKITKENQIRPIHVIELYYDGIQYGITTDEKYLSFKDWFYRFFF